MSTSLPEPLDPRALTEYRVDRARKAHARGLVLMRVNGKKPVGKAWQKQPPPTLDQVEAWARAGGLGLRTGVVSGVMCIDDDSADHSAAEVLGLPAETPTILTGRGNPNRLYKLPDFIVHNSVKRLTPCIDVRAEGGMVVFPGSIHPDTGRPYLWASGLSPEDVPFAELPSDIVAALRPRTSRPPPLALPPAKNQPERYAAGAIRGAALRVFDAREGERNATLNREAFGIARFIRVGLLDRGQVEAVLAEAARGAGLGEGEIAATLRSALEAGLRSDLPVVLPEARP